MNKAERRKVEQQISSTQVMGELCSKHLKALVNLREGAVKRGDAGSLLSVSQMIADTGELLRRSDGVSLELASITKAKLSAPIEYRPRLVRES
jgi:hypothetical protein